MCIDTLEIRPMSSLANGFDTIIDEGTAALAREIEIIIRDKIKE